MANSRVDQLERPLWLFEAFSVTTKAAAFQELPVHWQLGVLGPQPLQFVPFVEIQRTWRVIHPGLLGRDPPAQQRHDGTYLFLLAPMRASSPARLTWPVRMSAQRGQPHWGVHDAKPSRQNRMSGVPRGAGGTRSRGGWTG